MKKIVTLLSTLATASALSQNVTLLPNDGRIVCLAWDASPDASVTGYRIYYGAGSRSYTNSKTFGNRTNAIIENLVSNQEYYFSATAFDGNGLESDFSNECSYNTGNPSSACITNIGGTFFYQITHVRTTNDNFFPLMQSETTNNWRNVTSAQKISENEFSLGIYSTTWRVPASQPPVKQMYFKNMWLINYEDPNFKYKPRNIREIF